MPSYENDLWGQYNQDSGLGGGGYPYDPTLIPGYYNVMGDPLAGDSNLPATQAYSNPSLSPTPSYNDSSEPGFQSPTGYIPNPGYDPSTINDLPSTYNNPDLNPDPTSPVFSTTVTGKMPTDYPPLGTPPDVSNPPMDPFPSGIGTGITKPYPPPGTMTQGGTFPQRTSSQSSAAPPPTRNANNPMRKPPQANASSNMALGLGNPPPISNSLPSDQKFTYKPIAIARQASPNQPVAQGSTPSPATQATPMPGQNNAVQPSAISQIGQGIARNFGIPTSVKQLEQQWGLNRYSPYDAGL